MKPLLFLFLSLLPPRQGDPNFLDKALLCLNDPNCLAAWREMVKPEPVLEPNNLETKLENGKQYIYINGRWELVGEMEFPMNPFDNTPLTVDLGDLWVMSSQYLKTAEWRVDSDKNTLSNTMTLHDRALTIETCGTFCESKAAFLCPGDVAGTVETTTGKGFGDGVVNYKDFLWLSKHWGMTHDPNTKKWKGE